MNKYDVFNTHVIGASHIRKDKVCQDFTGSYCDELMKVVAVADGHGSDKYIRSDRGAKFAVESALSNIKQFVEDSSSFENLNDELMSQLMEQVGKSIISSWNDKVNENLIQNPLNDDEMNILVNNSKNELIAERMYGTTLIAIALTKNYWFGLHIGDGKCVVLNEDGSFTQPIPWDDKCFLNTTTSMCDEDALSEFRYFISEKLPIAIFINSDGVDDSYPIFENEKYLSKVYGAILKTFMDNGMDSGLDEVSNFLKILTDKGSGDDVSIAGILSIEKAMNIRNQLNMESDSSSIDKEEDL